MSRTPGADRPHPSPPTSRASAQNSNTSSHRSSDQPQRTIPDCRAYRASAQSSDTLRPSPTRPLSTSQPCGPYRPSQSSESVHEEYEVASPYQLHSELSGLPSNTYTVPSSPPLTPTLPAASTGLQHLSLDPATLPSADAPSTSSRPAPSRRASDAFKVFREPSSASSSRSPAAASAWEVPHKRSRGEEPRFRLQGIQPHPARSPRWDETPDHYRNQFSHLHPWASYVDPRPNFCDLSEDQVTAEAPLHVYRQLSAQGYFASRFVRSLFPRRFVGTPSSSNKVPLLELQRLQDIVAFRQHAIRLTTELLDHRYRDDSEDIQDLPPTPPGTPPSLLYPPSRNGIRPVLYQVVNRNYGQGVILEAKDFFIPGPDHRELQCIPMTQDSVNHLTRTRGFDKTQVSVKDFVWVLSLRPTLKTLSSWDRKTILTQSRVPRPSVIDSGYPYFFRVHEFILVTPPRAKRNVLGIVLAVNRRGPEGTANNLLVAFEGRREAVRVTQSICDFPLDQVEREDLLLAEIRPNVSCAMRFSHTAISVGAQRFLTNAVRRFVPAHPDEAILPLWITTMSAEDRRWVTERMGEFASYADNPASARLRMGQLFSMASAALASQATLTDDRRTHQVIAAVPSLTAIPMRLQLELSAMATDGGWSRARPVDIWIVDSTVVLRTRIASAQFSMSRRTIQVELHSETRTHNALRNTVRRYSTFDAVQNITTVPLFLRLGRVPSGTDPVFDFLACDKFSTLLRPGAPTVANTIMDMVYASPSRPIQADPAPSQQAISPITVRLQSRLLHLREDQIRAVRLGLADHPLLAIQAAYGTGKTVVGALIAAELAAPGSLIVATATTNVAVAQFTDTLLGLEEYQHNLTVLRFVADTALQEGAPTTSVDLHRILSDLLVNFSDTLTSREQERLTLYAHGRRLIERVLFNPAATLEMSDEEREEYRIAENNNSLATEKAVTIMFRVRFPHIICMTVSSLLNTTRPGGLFHDALSSCRLIIGDEASQIPEPAFVAMAAHFPTARHIYIGDVYQLEPHTRCPKSSLPAQLGSRGVMDLLFHKDVPLAPLVTTFRAHPALNELPNILVYDGSLRSGITARQRTLVTERLSLPNPSLPLVVVDVDGRSRSSHTQSHSNDEEANCTVDLVQALLDKNIPASSIAIITFYKDQQRMLERSATRFGVRLHTVDSVQGHEMDIVIILTTRTNIDRSSGDFLDDLRRLNVALTRCRHGLFILGRVEALRCLPNWHRLLRFAATREVIISRSSLPDLFL